MDKEFRLIKDVVRGHYGGIGCWVYVGLLVRLTESSVWTWITFQLYVAIH